MAVEIIDQLEIKNQPGLPVAPASRIKGCPQTATSFAELDAIDRAVLVHGNRGYIKNLDPIESGEYIFDLYTVEGGEWSKGQGVSNAEPQFPGIVMYDAETSTLSTSPLHPVDLPGNSGQFTIPASTPYSVLRIELNVHSELNLVLPASLTQDGLSPSNGIICDLFIKKTTAANRNLTINYGYLETQTANIQVFAPAGLIVVDGFDNAYIPLSGPEGSHFKIRLRVVLNDNADHTNYTVYIEQPVVFEQLVQGALPE